MISLASIAYHVAKLLSDDNQKIFIETALPYVERCCLEQQFNARIHNQFILKHLYELMKSIYGDKSVSKYKYIYQIAVTSLHRNSIESSIRIQDDFYLSHFHPINYYSLQTIFYEFPRLTNMNFDEWISPDVFKMLMFNRSDKHPLRLYNKNSLLSDTKSSVDLTKSFADLDDVSGMIKELIYTLDIELQKGLIIIASFADQPSNLDDIAKMCRTYKIKTLIVMNTDCVKNEELEYLSVSADKWLNIIQVEPRELQKFLLDRKNAGWSLIGIERTIHSVDIKTTPLEKKTIFILGNEKNGIPVNFIPLFDKCVEILQVNTKCPLSVHFTTAICIYQYIKQTS
ncbi:probable methyltransferase TARBP1 [Pogonomyrmex barbatus]|uniref:Probable methyltransferase TARBP1 n=1 Tax=Pogonomyrmex barbatus TaxID=144034 RepID=A0A6I9WWA3_9HYME|nr:probable methyltransferase TARBP1 [Pogonomyrmex barbatus]